MGVLIREQVLVCVCVCVCMPVRLCMRLYVREYVWLYNCVCTSWCESLPTTWSNASMHVRSNCTLLLVGAITCCLRTRSSGNYLNEIVNVWSLIIFAGPLFAFLHESNQPIENSYLCTWLQKRTNGWRFSLHVRRSSGQLCSVWNAFLWGAQILFYRYLEISFII